MNYYIFVVNDQKYDKKLIPAQDIFNTRMQQKRWGLAERTPNRKIIKADDKVIFYQAGKEGKVFLGYATIKSKADKLEADKEKIFSRSEQYYKIELDDINIFDEPKPISNYFEELEFIENIERWGAYLQGGTRKISENDFYTIIGSKTVATQTKEQDIESQTEFVIEKYLEEFIISNWEKIDFGMDLEIYKDNDGNIGQQYLTDVGYIDILANDKKGDFYIIELKKGKSSDKVVGQTLRYIGWVKKNLAPKSQSVKGIIIVGEQDTKLEFALEPVSNFIAVKLYNVNFKLSDYSDRE